MLSTSSSFVDVGAPGCSSDGGVFSATSLREVLEDGCVEMPDPEPLLNDEKMLPYHLAGEDAFPLQSWMMKTYPHRNMTKDEQIFSCQGLVVLLRMHLGLWQAVL